MFTLVPKCINGESLVKICPINMSNTFQDIVHVNNILDAQMDIGQIHIKHKCLRLQYIGRGKKLTTKQKIDLVKENMQNTNPTLNQGSLVYCRPMAERSKRHNAGFEKNAKNVFALALFFCSMHS